MNLYNIIVHTRGGGTERQFVKAPNEEAAVARVTQHRHVLAATVSHVEKVNV